MGAGAQCGTRSQGWSGTVGKREGWAGVVGPRHLRGPGSHMVKFGFVAELGDQGDSGLVPGVRGGR